MSNQGKFAAAILVLLAASTASATTTWTFSSSTTPTPLLNLTPTGDDTSVSGTATGWANTGGLGTQADQTLVAQDFRDYTPNGWGMKNSDQPSERQPYHAIDNNGPIEMALLEFTGKVNLTGVTVGYTGWDGDITLLAYQGSGTPSLTGLKWSTLPTGWKVIGNYMDFVPNRSSQQTAAITNNVYSSYWLVGAYNPLVPGGGLAANAGTDAVKLLTVSGAIEAVCTPGSPNCGGNPNNGVPEPGSLALLAGALLGMVGLRRRISA